MREEKSIKKKKEREKANIETKGIIIPKEQNCAVPMQYKMLTLRVRGWME